MTDPTQNPADPKGAAAGSAGAHDTATAGPERKPDGSFTDPDFIPDGPAAGGAAGLSTRLQPGGTLPGGGPGAGLGSLGTGGGSTGGAPTGAVKRGGR